MKIAFFEIEDREKELVKKELKGHELFFSSSHLDEEQLDEIKDFEVLVSFIYSSITKNVIDKLPNLKLIAAMSTGYEHIDIDYCRKKKIIVCNVPFYGENTVAEHTFALILALSRKLYPSIKITHEQKRFETDSSLRGFDLKGKTLGIIGLGRIGTHVARIAKGFEMNVLACTKHPDKKLVRELKIKIVTLNNLLKNSDIISLHVPYMKETHHMIDNESISKMKNGVYIINTARGGVIDTDALYLGLKSGKIAGAALDVLEEEAELKEEKLLLHQKHRESARKIILEDHKLMGMDTVIITPHNAFNSTEALHRIIKTTIDNIKGFMKKKIINAVK